MHAISITIVTTKIINIILLESNSPSLDKLSEYVFSTLHVVMFELGAISGKPPASDVNDCFNEVFVIFPRMWL